MPDLSMEQGEDTMAHSRRARLDKRQADAIETRQVNATKKSRERARRDARMMETIRAGALPFTPDVMSWLSAKLDKPARKITAEDVSGLLAS
jgi:hypothetical protein